MYEFLHNEVNSSEYINSHSDDNDMTSSDYENSYVPYCVFVPDKELDGLTYSHAKLNTLVNTQECLSTSLEYPTMPPAGSSKVLRAPVRRGGTRRTSQTKIYNLETGE